MSLDSRNAELDEKIKETDLPNAVGVLINDAKKRRRQLRWLAISIILDFILTIGLTVLSLRTNEVARLAQKNKDAVFQNCEISNDARKKQLTLWNYILALPPSKPPTPEQQAQSENFKRFIDSTFAQRDCHAELSQ